MFRVSQLKTEFLPLLSVSFVSENSVVAAVSVFIFFLVEYCSVLESEKNTMSCKVSDKQDVPWCHYISAINNNRARETLVLHMLSRCVVAGP